MPRRLIVYRGALAPAILGAALVDGAGPTRRRPRRRLGWSRARRRDSALPPMGMRVRVKSSINVATFPPQTRVILRARQRYGMFVADNGSAFYVSGAPGPWWSDDDLHAMTSLHGSDVEVVRMGPVSQ
jgi:hypothetical protein